MKAAGTICWLVFSFVAVQSRYINRRDVSQGFKICLEVLLLKCDSTYRPEGDETVCASNGITYSNLCHYAQARCAKPGINLLYSGHCGRTTPSPTPPSTTHMLTTTTRPTTAVHRTTWMRTTTRKPTMRATFLPTTTPLTTQQLTMTPPTTTPPTTTPPTTTPPTTTPTTTRPPSTTPPTTGPPTKTLRTTNSLKTSATASTFNSPTGNPVLVTVDPGLDIVKQIFCLQADHIVCNSELEPICGTDGLYYLNRCIFAKAECEIKGLEPQHLDLCKRD